MIGHRRILKEANRVRVWDAPTRIVHWLVVVLLGLAWWTEAHDQMPQHLLVGYTLVGLLVFRVAWGFCGSSTARFASFVRGPRTVLRYAKSLTHPGAEAAVIGHNPMGGWSVAALLCALAAVVGTGLFASDTDGVASGPLASKVSYGFSDAAAHCHSVAFDVLIALAALHLAAVAFYLVVRRDNLVAPLIHGHRRSSSAEGALKPAGWRAFIGAAALGGLVAIVLARL